MVKIVIRNTKLMDLKQMSASNKRNLTENYDMDYWSETFNTNGGKKHSFVATFASEIIGYIFASDDCIISFAIDEPFRRFGIGKQLLAHCLNTFTNFVTLHVRKSNEAARNLYKSFDFTDNRLIEGYYTNEDAYEMIHKYNNKKYSQRSKLNVAYVKPKSDNKEVEINNIEITQRDNKNLEWLESQLRNLNPKQLSQLESLLEVTENKCEHGCDHQHHENNNFAELIQSGSKPNGTNM